MSKPALVFRKLLSSETRLLRDHFLRLDADDRHLRFRGHVGDTVIESYCAGAFSAGSLVLGCFVEGTLCGVAELRPQGGLWDRIAEVAITVERPHQDRGIGTKLLKRVISLARNRSIQALHLFCLIDNARMQHVCHKLGGALKIADGEVEAIIDSPWPTYWTMLDEALLEMPPAIQEFWLADVVAAGTRRAPQPSGV